MTVCTCARKIILYSLKVFAVNKSNSLSHVFLFIEFVHVRSVTVSGKQACDTSKVSTFGVEKCVKLGCP